mgnify:CR=1 FL=1
MARITVEDCVDKFPSRFELVLVASQRARELHSGETPTIDKDNDKNTVIALREIAEVTIPIEKMKENVIEGFQKVTINDEEDENFEIKSLEDIEKVYGEVPYGFVYNIVCEGGREYIGRKVLQSKRKKYVSKKYIKDLNSLYSLLYLTIKISVSFWLVMIFPLNNAVLSFSLNESVSRFSKNSVFQ